MWTVKYQVSVIKAVLVNELISDYDIDLLCLTETWLSHEDYVSLNESTPPSHINTHIPEAQAEEVE